MDKLEMDTTEKQVVAALLDKFEAEFVNLESDETLHRATVIAHELPPRIRLAMDAFRLERGSGVLCISGYEVDQAGPRHLP